MQPLFSSGHGWVLGRGERRTEHDKSPAINEDIQAAAGVGIAGGVPENGALLPTAALQVAALNTAHVVVAGPREHPQPVLEHRRKVPAHHLGR